MDYFDSQEKEIFSSFFASPKPKKKERQKAKKQKQQNFNLVGALTSKEAKQGYGEAYKLTKKGARAGYGGAKRVGGFLKKRLFKKKSIYGKNEPMEEY